MKTCVRIGSLVIALGLTGLLAGCTSQSSSAAYRTEPARDFEVVETSTKRQLSAREMAYLRAKVAEYLAQEGQTGSGDYYVKIYLGEENGVEQGEWVVVRFTRYPSARFSLLASYSNTYPSYPRYSYDYYPFGFFGFSSLAFSYYDDPYYYGYNRAYPAWYHPRYNGSWRNHRPGHRPDGGKDDDHNRPHHGYRPSGATKPSFVPSAVVNRNRWDGTPPAFDGRRRGTRPDFQPRNGFQPRPDLQPRDGSRPRWRDRANRPSSTQPANNFTPTSPPAAPAVPSTFRPATRSELHRDRGVGETARPSRAERADGQRAQGGRERVYTPPVRTPSTAAPRPADVPRQEARSNDQPASRSDSSSDQTPRFHGGGYKKIEQ